MFIKWREATYLAHGYIDKSYSEIENDNQSSPSKGVDHDYTILES